MSLHHMKAEQERVQQDHQTPLAIVPILGNVWSWPETWNVQLMLLTSDISGSPHLISQAGWNTCDLILSYLVLVEMSMRPCICSHCRSCIQTDLLLLGTHVEK